MQWERAQSENEGHAGTIRISIGNADYVRAEPAAAMVTHHTRIKATELLTHQQAKMLSDLKPVLTCVYKGNRKVGTYPCGTDGAISLLAFHDRNLITEFLEGCNAGAQHQSSLVTSVKQLATVGDLAHMHCEGYCMGISEAFINPYTNRQGTVQMSAQFNGIVVSRDDKAITFMLTTTCHKSSSVTLTGSGVYSAFERGCTGAKSTMQKLRGLYANVPASAQVKVDVLNTCFAGHKVWVHSADAEFVTLYLMRHTAVKRGKLVQQLMIVAADIGVQMQEVQAYEPLALECAICLEEVTGTCWKCVRCCNKLHTECATVWKQNPGASCPFCRAPL